MRAAGREACAQLRLARGAPPAALPLAEGGPAETGQIFGMLTPVLYGVSNLRKIDVRIRPVFDQAAFSGHAAMVISVVPAMLVPPFLRFGWASFGPGR